MSRKTLAEDRRTDSEVLDLIRSDDPLSKARAVFSGECGRLEQADEQTYPPGIIEIRRMEFEAVEAIAVALEHPAWTAARPLEEWHEDLGPVLWWRLPVEEAPWAGTPNDSDWPMDQPDEPYYTHFTRLWQPTNAGGG